MLEDVEKKILAIVFFLCSGTYIYWTLFQKLQYCMGTMWRGQCGETLKDKLQTLQNKAAATIAKLRYF